MSVRQYLGFILLLLAGSVSTLPARSGVEIEYQPARLVKSGENLPVELTVTNFSGVPISEVMVHYRYTGESRFKSTPLKNEGFRYLASLNVGNEAGIVEHYFTVLYMDNRREAYPDAAGSGKMFRTSVQQLRNYGDDIVIISPESEEQIYSTDIVITASFGRLASMVDIDKTKIYLDTWDISRYLLKYEDFVSFAPRKVPVGKHKIRLELYDNNNSLVASREWYFTAIPSRLPEEPEGKLKLDGRFFAEAREERLRDAQSVNDYNQAGLQLRGNTGALTFGGRVYLNNQERDDRQPVNRYSGFARYSFWNNRFIDVTYGDSYPKMNSMIMQNVLLRGLYSRAHLKFFNIDFAYGKTRRAIESEGSLPGTFRRELLAVRPSFGDGKNFQMGITYLRGEDDTTSIDFGREPEQNAAFGADMFLGLDNQNVVFEGNVNASAYNRNITGGSIEYDTLKQIFAGQPGEEFDLDKDFYDLAKKFITVNEYLILRPGIAYQARLRLRYFRNSLSVLYESVDEDFYSLGQPYLLRDNRGYHIVDNISLLGNQLFLNLGLRKYHDNLQDSKNNTTDITGYYANISYFPLGNFPEITVGYNNYARENGVANGEALYEDYVNGQLSPEETIEFQLNRPEDNQTNSINLSTGYQFKLSDLKNRIGANLMSYRRTDINPYGENSSDFFSINLKTEYRFPLQSQLEFMLQQTESAPGTDRQSTLEMTTYGVGLQYLFKNLIAGDRLLLKTNARFGIFSSNYQITGNSYDYNRNYYSFRINYAYPGLGHIGLGADILTYSGDLQYNDYIYNARFDYDF